MIHIMSEGDLKLSIGVVLGSVVLIGLIVGAAVLFDKPDQVDVTTAIGDSVNISGNASAETVVVEFSDFECPACASVEPVVQQFMETYGDQIKFVYRHFPLPQHTNADAASYAAEAAALQGKFWQVHNWLFDNQSVWIDGAVDADYFYGQFGEKFGLDQERFSTDYKSDAVRSVVSADRSAGQGLGVNSTPTFFINGKKHAGTLSLAQMVELTGVQEPTPTIAVEPTTALEVTSTPDPTVVE